MVKKYEFYGSEPGKNLLVLAAVHGNEQAGTRAMERLLKEIDEKKIVLTKGKLTLVPVCNEKAYEKDVRQIDENLNRVIKIHENPQTYEQKVANEICQLIQENDIMLDLHSTHCEGDVPFIICDYPDAINEKFMNVLPVGYILYGWPDVYAHQKNIEDCCTEHYAHMCGCSGITLECGYHKSEDAVEVAYQAIINTMSVLSMIEAHQLNNRLIKKKILIKDYVIKRKEGHLFKEYKHLDRVQKGETIAQYMDGETLYADKEGYILLPNSNADVGTEWYYLGQDFSF